MRSRWGGGEAGKCTRFRVEIVVSFALVALSKVFGVELLARSRHLFLFRIRHQLVHARA